jgi:hypothetical protein
VNRATYFALLVLFPLVAAGHHSFAEFDMGAIEELEGQISDIRWTNPHVRLTLQTSGVGTESTWNLEAQDVNSLGRRGLRADSIQVGDKVTVAGYPSRRRDQTLFVTNVLLPSGTEIRTRGETKPRWSSELVGFDEPNVAEIQALAPKTQGIFRVWMPIEDAVTPADLPLTAVARTKRSAWNPADNLALKCIGSGMPAAMVMSRYHPISFSERDGEIVLSVEVFDTVRTIDMRPQDISKQTPAPLGYSAGHWEDGTLVVHTTRVNWPYFDSSGSIPQSDAVEITERFAVRDDENQLVYERSVRDPATFTEPVSQTVVLEWRPDLVVEPWKCTRDP